jgi:formylglycine-generating enzyme
MSGRLGARLLALVTASGCAAQLAPGAVAPLAIEASEEPPRGEGKASTTEALASSDAESVPQSVPACGENMALVERKGQRFCIDLYEASLVRRAADGATEDLPGNRGVDGLEAQIVAISRPGVKPQGYIRGTQAKTACENAGKRLCRREEWLSACRGPDDTQYPYGDERKADVCNDRFKYLTDHPVVNLYRKELGPDADPRGMWTPRWMNDPRLHEMPLTLEPTGSHRQCTNEYGAFDMVGNLHEWIDDPNGTFLGGYFMDTFQNGEGCSYRTRGHEFEYRDYSIGFRCCDEPADATDREHS